MLGGFGGRARRSPVPVREVRIAGSLPSVTLGARCHVTARRCFADLSEGGLVNVLQVSWLQTSVARETDGAGYIVTPPLSLSYHIPRGPYDSSSRS